MEQNSSKREPYYLNEALSLLPENSKNKTKQKITRLQGRSKTWKDYKDYGNKITEKGNPKQIDGLNVRVINQWHTFGVQLWIIA